MQKAKCKMQIDRVRLQFVCILHFAFCISNYISHFTACIRNASLVTIPETMADRR
jgi:hypothetical protein